MKKKLVYALLAVLISFGLWFYVITVENPEWEDTFYNVPVVLDNETVLHDRGMMVISEKTPTVTLKLSGNRSDMNKLNNANITLVADLSRIYETGEQTLSYVIMFPGDIPANAITVLSQNPAQLKVTVAERDTKEVPVVPTYSGKVPEGFMTDRENLILDREYITVTGPAAVVEKITQAQIQVDLEGRTETINQKYNYTLCDAEGNEVDDTLITKDVSEVNLTLKIQRYKEVELRLDVIPGGGLTLENTSISMNIQTIIVSGSEQQLADLEYLVLGRIDLATIIESETKTYTISTRLPAGLTNQSGTDTVTVEIKIPELATKTVKITKFVPIGLPEHLEANILTQELTVTFRGPKAQLDRLTAQHITAQVDFSGAEAGVTDTKKVTFLVSEDISGVGAIHSYNVSATVEEIPVEG